MYRLTIKDILEATGGVLLCGDENTEIKDVCINSKEIKPGDLFVPIIGERVDAHRFIESALHTGAATLTSQHTDIVVSEKPFVYVSDTEKALQDIGAYVRRKFKKPVIGVTGSVGKTTTRQMIATVLSGCLNVYQTEGNLNSQIGKPYFRHKNPSFLFDFFCRFFGIPILFYNNHLLESTFLFSLPKNSPLRHNKKMPSR